MLSPVHKAILQTRITALFGIEKPILLSGMSWISTPKLVAAVSNAGGLGILATGPLSPEQTCQAIREIRALTERPFGIGCTLLMPGATENARVAIAEKVPVINFSLGKGDWLTREVHAYGGKVIATVTTLKHAQSAVDVGVDALLVTGHEAAAHGGEVGNLVLVPSMARHFNLPIIAAGGVADGDGLAAILSLGGDGVAMGSRLATSLESPVHQTTKNAVVSGNMHETIYSQNFDGIPARYMATATARQLTKKPMPFLRAALEAVRAAKLVNMSVIKIMLGLLLQPDKVKMLAYFGAAMPRLKTATVDGDLQKGMQFIGQSQGLIEDIAPVADIMQRVIDQAAQRIIDNADLLKKN